MAPLGSTSRRNVLAALGASGLGGLAGCNTDRSRPADPRPTDEVIFTDSATPGAAAPTSTAAEPSTTAPRTSEPEPRVFDGGDVESFAAALRAADDSGGRLVVEEGRYRFDPLNPRADPGLNAHAEFRNVEDVTVEGNGARFVFTNPLVATFVFEGGTDVTLTDLSLDYDPLPFTQGTITDRASSPPTVELSLDDGFPALDHGMFSEAAEVYGLVHEPDGDFVRGIRKRGSWDPRVVGVSEVGDRTYEVRIDDAFGSGGLVEGRRLTVLARNNAGGVFFEGVDSPTLRNVSVHATNGAAIVMSVCKDPVVRNCVVAPPEGSERHIGANADGIRVVNCRSSAVVEGCRHEYLGDDSLVVQHTMSPVTSVVDERTVEVADVHPFVVGTGDVLECMSPDGIVKGALSPVADYEERFSTPRDREKPETITFEDPVANVLSEGDFLRNRATGSRNFAVRDNEFRNHRANLVRIAASHGVVENNTLEGCSINPIELETDTYGHFAPKGWASDVTVRNNEIARAGLAYFAGANPVGIHVHHRPAPEHTSEGRPNHDISVENNEIAESAAGAIHVEATESIRIDGNTMTGPNRMDFPGFADVGVSLHDVADATVTGNAVRGSEGSVDHFGTRRSSRRIVETNNELVVDGEPAPAELVALRPVKLAFDRTVRPSDVNPGSGDDRPLAFRCSRIALVDSSGDAVVRIDVGGEESGVSFGSGVWPPSSDGDWRWFGGAAETAVLYFAEADLEEATELRLRGYPMVEDVSAVVYVRDRRAAEVSFGRRETRTFVVPLG